MFLKASSKKQQNLYKNVVVMLQVRKVFIKLYKLTMSFLENEQVFFNNF